MFQRCNVIIRRGRGEDIPNVLKNIKELARYLKLENHVKITPQQLLKDGGFCSPSDPKLYELLVAEAEIEAKKELVGHALWHYSYTTWESKIACIEDLFIDDRFRRRGLAKRFFNLISKEVLANNGAWLKLYGMIINLSTKSVSPWIFYIFFGFNSIQISTSSFNCKF